MLALAPIAPKLAKLIPRLASTHEGEVVATARAIERTLRGAGLDLHSLASAVEAPPETKEIIVYRDRPPPEVEPDTWVGVARWCRDHDDDALTAKERAFVTDMTARLTCDGTLSEKQAAWLRAIYVRLRKETTS